MQFEGSIGLVFQEHTYRATRRLVHDPRQESSFLAVLEGTRKPDLNHQWQVIAANVILPHELFSFALDLTTEVHKRKALNVW